MRPRRDSEAVATAPWSWRGAMVAGAIAAASAGGCATDPPPRPAQIDPSNPGAPESTPLEVGGDVLPVMPSDASAPRSTGEEGAEAGAPEPPQHRPEHQHGEHEQVAPPRQQPAHQHEHGGGGAP